MKKILKSFLDRFQAKVTAIEENKEVDTNKVKELIGSLQTFKTTLKQRKKEKSIALKTIQAEAQDDGDKDMSEQLANLTKVSTKV